MKYEFICLLCSEIQQEGAPFLHDCPREAVIPKRVQTRWQRFHCWFWSLDLTYFLATGGALLISGIYTNHFNYSLTEGIFHGLGSGFVIGRVIRYGQ